MASTMNIKANGQKFESGQAESEALRFAHDIEAQTNDRGVMTARPTDDSPDLTAPRGDTARRVRPVCQCRR
jgi:hypothetical protein